MLLNTPSLCFICRRRSDNVAVGKPEKLAWFCLGCGAQLAKDAYDMGKKFDTHERAAIEKVAAKLPAEDFNVPAEELPRFVEWLIEDFGDELRQELAETPPF